MKRASRLLFAGVLIAVLAMAGYGMRPQTAVGQEPVSIRYQDWRLAEEPAGPSLTTMVEAFMENNPGINVEMEPVSVGEKVDLFVTQARGGNPPDVVRVLTTDVPPFVAMGALRSLEDFVDEAGGQEYKDLFSDFLINAVTFDGDLYCIPHEGDAFVLYINTRLWEAAGLDPDNPPTTFEELREANLALTNAAENRYAFGMLAEPAISAIWMQSWFLAHGTDFFTPDYSDTLIDTPEGIEAFSFYTAMYTEDGAVPPGPTEVNYGAQVALFAQETVAYIQGPYATLGSILAANPDLEPYLKVIPFPGTRATAGRGSVLCVSAASEHPAEAWALIQWLTSVDNQLAHFEEATMMPTQKAALEQIDFEQYPIAQVFIEEAIPVAGSYPVFADWPQSKAVLDEALALTLLGETDAETAMHDAATQIREILAEE